MRLVVVGLGSELMGDDAAGLKVIDILSSSFPEGEVNFKKCFSTGFESWESIEGYDTAIIVDSVCTGRYPKGEVLRIEPEEMRHSKRIASFHDFDLFSSVELGKRLGLRMPSGIQIYGIEIEESTDFSEKLSPEVERGVLLLAGRISQEIERYIADSRCIDSNGGISDG